MSALLSKIVTSENIFFFSQYIVYAVAVLVLVFILLRWRLQSTDFKWLAFYFILSLSADWGSLILFRFNSSPNYTNNAFAVLSLPVFLMFSYYASRKKFGSGTLILVGIMHFVFALVNLLFFQRNEFNSYTTTVNSLIIIVVSIFFFFRLLEDLPTTHVFSLPLFWIMSAFFFTHAGKLVIYSARHYFMHYLQDNLLVLWTIHNFLSVIGNLLILYGAWLKHKQLRSTYSSQ